MADQLQLRGGTTTEHSTFTGALKEITVDTTKKTIVVHDNSTVGGIPLAKENLSNVPAGTITSTMIADGTIATADIADSAVTSAKIADGTIVNADINANAAIDLSKLANGALPSGITVGSSNITDLSIATADIADGAVTSAKIADGTIVNADVSATASIALSKLATGSLPAAITVNSSNIEDLSIVTGDLADGAVTSAKIADGTIINGDINSNAAIDLGKLAVGALPTGITIASANIVDGTIVNADINTAAAIAGTKISPDFGSQNVTTTGTSTSASFIPSSSTVPPNGVYLPAANSVGISTNSTERLRITSTGVGIGVNAPQKALHISTPGSTNDGAIQLGGSTYYGTIEHDASSSGANIYTVASASGGGHIFKRGSTEQMRLDASSRLLLGTSTARSNFFNSTYNAKNQIEGTGTGASSPDRGALAVVNNSSGDDAPLLILAKSKGTAVGSNTLCTNNEWVGHIAFQANDGTEFVELANIVAQVDGASGANDMPGRLVFSTTADGASSPTERMRIDKDGNTRFLGQNVVVTRMQRNSGTGTVIELGIDGNTPGTISCTTTTTSYNTSSDYRLKENVTTVTDGITRLQQLKPSRFNFIEDPDRTVDGFIAHEVQAVVPEAITGEKDAEDEDGKPIYQGIDQSKLVPLLTAALQEAIGRIETLEAEVAALKAQ